MTNKYNLTVLLVEDDAFQRKLLISQLNSLGVKEAIPSTNGMEAIEAIKKINYSTH